MLSPDFLKQVVEDSYAELYPFFSNDEIIRNSQYDYYKDANLENLKAYLIMTNLSLRASNTHYLKYLENRNN